MKKFLLFSLALAMGSWNVATAQNTSFGIGALGSVTTGTNNSAFGAQSLFSTTTGHYNNGFGKYALYSNVNGSQNIAMGYAALYSNTSGNENIAIGSKALATNTTGNGNIGIGEGAINNNTTANYNVATGYFALSQNSTGAGNVASGYHALNTNSTGGYNVASGYEALQSNTTGGSNSAIGHYAAMNNTTGYYNVAHGYAALYSNTTGELNVALGGKALANNITGSDNVAVGTSSGPNNTNYSNTTALGNNAITTASNQVRIGNTFVTSIGGYQAWTNLSDGRFKGDIQENVMGLDFINQLRPVSYVVDQNKLDEFLGATNSEFYKASTGEQHYQTGFIAQEVDELTQKLGFTEFNGVDRPENDGDHYGLRYSEFVVPLVKAVQELSANQEQLLKTIEEQQVQIDALTGRDKTSATGLENAGADNPQVELYQNAPNPFTTDTQIKMVLPENVQQAQIIIYNLEGKQLKAYDVEGNGETSVTIHGNELEAGMYIYALITDGSVASTKQMILSH
ncbi:tail fiber domain-containing protein [bacterium SCSIO 12741]|nr:tail fiber domain-containing protein [bacterium SCSIO 12741]